MASDRRGHRLLSLGQVHRCRVGENRKNLPRHKDRDPPPQSHETKKGKILDLDVDGIEVDVKNTIGKNWTIPNEAHNHPCLFISTDEKKAVCTESHAGSSRGTQPRTEPRSKSHRSRRFFRAYSLAIVQCALSRKLLGNRDIYLTPPCTTCCGLTRVANGTGSVCMAC